MYTLNDVAVLLGVILLLTAGPLLIDRKHTLKMYHELLKSRALMYVAGLLIAIVGLMILNVTSHIALTFEGIIALVGWLTLLKGVLFALFPEHVYNMSKPWFKSDSFATVGGLAALIIALWLFWTGLGM